MSATTPPAGSSIFSRIIRGEVPSHRVYEDDRVVAFLDVGPLSRGHMLVVPREEQARLEDLSEESAAALGRVLPRLARALMKATGCTAYNILINNGKDAGQVVLHVHAHIIPKSSDGRGLTKEWRSSKLDPAEGAALANELRGALAGSAAPSTSA
ncbi:MAG: HIT family protein [Phycisphaerae bacterium]|nr:HIT family protein [Phycisphaerae bacterium]